jgi:hypothetical protein
MRIIWVNAILSKWNSCRGVDHMVLLPIININHFWSKSTLTHANLTSSFHFPHDQDYTMPPTSLSWLFTSNILSRLPSNEIIDQPFALGSNKATRSPEVVIGEWPNDYTNLGEISVITASCWRMHPFINTMHVSAGSTQHTDLSLRALAL